MKKFVAIFAMMFAFVFANAQTLPIKQDRFFDETYVGVELGYGAKVHSWDWEGLNLGLRWGKWFTPQIGAEFEGGIQFSDNSTNRVLYHRVGVNALLNLDYLNGYRGHRNLCEVVPFVGVGWQRNYQYWDHGYFKMHPVNTMYTKMGLHIDFNLKNGWQMNIIPAVAYTFPEYKYDVRNLDMSLMVGVTYNFKNSHGTHWFETCDKVYTQAQMDEVLAFTNELRENNEMLRAALEDCLNRPTTVVSEVETKTVVKPVFATIGFEQNSDKILGVYDLNVRTIADFMKASNQHFTIVGFASEEGNAEYNQALSVRRAEAVAEALESYGVDPAKLHVEGKGATTEFGNALDLNRTVQIVAE